MRFLWWLCMFSFYLKCSYIVKKKKMKTESCWLFIQNNNLEVFRFVSARYLLTVIHSAVLWIASRQLIDKLKLAKAVQTNWKLWIKKIVSYIWWCTRRKKLWWTVQNLARMMRLKDCSDWCLLNRCLSISF